MLQHEEKGAKEDELARQYHQFNGDKFQQIPADSEGQGSLVCCSPWGHKESDMTQRLNDNKDMHIDITYDGTTWAH